MSYEDIINLPHPVSANHPHMPLYDRAAQFSPFAALTGYESAIREAARLTQEQPELEEEQKTKLNRQLQLLAYTLSLDPSAEPGIKIVYFQRDSQKIGGASVIYSGKIKKIDGSSRQILFTDGTTLSLENILSMEGEVFRILEETGL